MARTFQLYQVFYTLHSDGLTSSRFCLAYSSCHAVQVLIRSLVSDGYELNSFDIGHCYFHQTYR